MSDAALYHVIRWSVIFSARGGRKEDIAGSFFNKVPVPKAQTETCSIPDRANDVSSQRPSCRSIFQPNGEGAGVVGPGRPPRRGDTTPRTLINWVIPWIPQETSRRSSA
jgi:hypothetical protein